MSHKHSYEMKNETLGNLTWLHGFYDIVRGTARFTESYLSVCWQTNITRAWKLYSPVISIWSHTILCWQFLMREYFSLNCRASKYEPSSLCWHVLCAPCSLVGSEGQTRDPSSGHHRWDTPTPIFQDAACETATDIHMHALFRIRLLMECPSVPDQSRFFSATTP